MAPPVTSLAEVLEQHPLLTDYGIGIWESHKKTVKERIEETKRGQDYLRSREDEIRQTMIWLIQNVSRIKTINTRDDSYSLKHVMERATEVYVTNGEFIAAALMAEYPYIYSEPNVRFGMSTRDFQTISRASQ